MKIAQAVIDRFWSKVDIRGPDECWPWLAGRFKRKNGKKSYGAFQERPGKLVKAHRFALEITSGRRLSGDERACHSCDNEPCCNPSHLWRGTSALNNHDRNAKGRTARGETSGVAVLTENEVRKIRTAKGTQMAIARAYGVCKATVWNIKQRKTWSHVS